MYLFWILALALIANTEGESLGSNNEDELVLSVDPKFIEPGLTKSLHLNCSFSGATDGTKIMLMAISRHSGPEEMIKGGDIAGINSFENHVSQVDPEVGFKVVGDISLKTSGFLSMLWEMPKCSVQATYVCRAILLKKPFGTSELKADGKVTCKAPQMTSVIKRLGALDSKLQVLLQQQKQQLQENKKLKEFLSTLVEVNPTWSERFWISMPWKGRRYFLSHSVIPNVKKAQESCEGLGGYLMVPDTKGEYEFVVQFIHSYPQPNMKENDHILFGATEEGHEGTWTSLHDGKPVGYLRWYAGEPNNYRGTKEHCVEYRPKYPGFNDMRCDGGGRRYLCEVPQKSGSPVF